MLRVSKLGKNGETVPYECFDCGHEFPLDPHFVYFTSYEKDPNQIYVRCPNCGALIEMEIFKEDSSQIKIIFIRDEDIENEPNLKGRYDLIVEKAIELKDALIEAEGKNFAIFCKFENVTVCAEMFDTKQTLMKRFYQAIESVSNTTILGNNHLENPIDFHSKRPSKSC